MKDCRVIVRISEDERDYWKDSAKDLGMTLSDWIRLRCSGDSEVVKRPWLEDGKESR